jgi:hypothetical protein
MRHRCAAREAVRQLLTLLERASALRWLAEWSRRTNASTLSLALNISCGYQVRKTVTKTVYRVDKFRRVGNQHSRGTPSEQPVFIFRSFLVT